MSMILDRRGNPISPSVPHALPATHAAQIDPEFNPFTDDELAAMDPSTRTLALSSARAWWSAEKKRHRKAEKRLRDIGAKHVRRGDPDGED